MVELELVASRMAVAHLLNDQYLTANRPNGIYQGPVTRQKLIERLTAARMAWNKNHGRTISTDEQARIEEIARQLIVQDLSHDKDEEDNPAEPSRMLWPQVIACIVGMISRCSNTIPRVRYELARSLDELFFVQGNLGLSHHGAKHENTADAHIHVGGSVPWDLLWTQLMNQQYPSSFFSRASFRILNSGKESLTLLRSARRAREVLLSEHGLWVQRFDPGVDRVLFSRVWRCHSGIEQGRFSANLRDYVLVRSLFRREMVCGEVNSLDEFCGAAWKRYWGQKPTGVKAVGGYGLLRRYQRLSDTKTKVAVQHISQSLGVRKASLRMNLDPKPTIGWLELRHMVQCLDRIPSQPPDSIFGLVIHARRPSASAKRSTDLSLWKKSWADSRRHWESNLAQIERLQDTLLLNVPLGLDLAGPERNVNLFWFLRALRHALGLARDHQKIRITVHAGEDFYDPWNGLARVCYAAYLFKKFIKNDHYKGPPRIGHGSILGVDPYAIRWSRFSCPVWARREALRFASYLNTKLLPHDSSCRWGWSPPEERAQLKNTPAGLYIEVIPSAAEKDAFYEAQKYCVKKVKEAGTIIETNPTSNLFVLGVPDYTDVPVWGLLAHDLKVIMGTDNPGMFNISSEEEYARLHEAFYRLRQHDQTPLQNAYIPSSIQAWLKRKTTWQDIEETLRKNTARDALIAEISKRLLP